MTDCEYIKLNTSIQTASNAGKIPETEDGTIPAVIELRLPDNIFPTRKGGKKLDNVTMLTTKLRVSQTETPIVQLPRDKELSEMFKTNVSTCQLDVYPYTIINDTEVRPTPGADMVFPAYKAHEIVYKIRLFQTITPLTSITIDTVTAKANILNQGFPKSNMFYPVLKKAGILDKIDKHLMNLCIAENRSHKADMDQDDQIFLRDIADMEKMLGDALENAVTYACTQDHIEVFIDLVDMIDGINMLDPPPDTSNTIELPDYGITACFWKYEKDIENSTSTSLLNFAFKPKVTIESDSLTISYDSAAFKDNIPVVYSPEYVNTYSHAPQLTLDDLRKDVWYQPPPKRIYKYGIAQDAETSTYAFSLLENINCMLMNIIANKSLKEALSFLPWIKVNTTNIPELTPYLYMVQERKDVEKTTTPVDVTKRKHIQGTSEYSMSQCVYVPNDGVMQYIFKADGTQYPHGTPWTSVEKSDRQEQKVVYICSLTDLTPPDEITLSTTMDDAVETNTSDIFASYKSTDATLEVGEHLIQHTDINTNELVSETTASTDAQSIYTFDVTSGGETGQRLTLYQFDTNKYGTWDESCPPNSRYRYFPISGYDISSSDTEEVVDSYRTWTVTFGGPSGASWADATHRQIRLLFLGNNTRVVEHRSVEIGTEDIYQIVEELPQTGTVNISPNLDIDDENSFYILDGNACQVKLGEQEPIKGETSQQYNFRIDTEEAVTDLQYKDDVVITRGAVDPVNFNPQAFSYRIETDIVAPGPGTAEPKNCVMYEFETQTSDPLTTRTNQKFYTRFFPQGVANMPQDVEILSSTPGEYQSQPLPAPTTTTTYSNDPTLEPGRYVHEPVVHDPESETFPSEWVPGSDPQIYRTRFHVYTGLQWQWVEGQIDPYGTLPQWIPDPAYNRYISSITLAPDRYLWRVYWEIRYHHMDTSTDLPVAIEPNFWVYKYRPVQTVTRTTKRTTQETDIITDCSTAVISGIGNIRLSFVWNNLPMVILSPISSIVMTLQGVDATQEIQPININQPGAASLISTIPIVENYVSLAQTLRDLHDELVIIKDSYDDAAKYQLTTTSGQERTLTLAMKYITKDGRLHQLYIPKDGVFSVQLTFALSFYLA